MTSAMGINPKTILLLKFSSARNGRVTCPTEPTTSPAGLDTFVHHYNHHRPHRSLPHRATPAGIYDTLPKAVPGPSHDTNTHDRIRHDIVDKSGTVTLRIHGQLRHIGIGRTHTRTHVILLVQDLDVRIINAITGELLRELTIDPDRDYQPRNTKDPNPQ